MRRRWGPAAVTGWAVIVAGVLYASAFAYRGWIAHDEGTIAQSAERALRGEVPHRDFDEVYTGGLTYLHAGAMRVFGINLRALRLMLLGFFAVFLIAAWAVARRVGSEWAAVVAISLIVVWSVPNYFASIPSWYTLFFATFGVLALLQFVESGQRRWLYLAGACGGCSILMKITGVYFVAAGVLFLVFLDQIRSVTSEPRRAKAAWRWPAVRIVLLAGVLGAVGHWGLHLDGRVMFDLGLPPAGIAGLLAWQGWRDGTAGVAARVRRILALVGPFGIGVAVPVGLFVAWYWQHGALADLARGVFILPQRRLTEASLAPPPVATLGLIVPYVTLLLAGRGPRLRHEAFLAAGLAAMLGCVLFLGTNPIAYRATWAFARGLPLAAVVTFAWLHTGSTRSADENAWPLRNRAQALLLVTVTSCLALVQFPYASPTYFFYVAPMVVLSLTALLAARPYAPRRAHLVVAVFMSGFALAFLNRSYGWNLGVAFIPYRPAGFLHLDRGGLSVPAADQETYEELVRVLRQHADGGTIYAGPDCPEVYFLSGFPNPTRAVFEFLTPEVQDEAWMVRLLARAPIRAAVINTDPLFSRALAPGARRQLESRFPSSQQIGRFIVRFE